MYVCVSEMKALDVCLSVCMSVCLSLCLSVCLYVCLSMLKKWKLLILMMNLHHLVVFLLVFQLSRDLEKWSSMDVYLSMCCILFKYD